MQNEESVFCRALEPNFVTHRASVRASICVADSAAQWSCSSEGEVLWAVGPGQSTVVAGVVQGISLTISVPSPIGRHHKMRGEHWPQPPLPLARVRCLQLWSLPQGYLLRPAAWEMNSSHQVQPPCPISSPTPEAAVMPVSEEEEEKTRVKQEACCPFPSAGSKWSTMVSLLHPQKGLSPLILSRALFAWGTCLCGLDIASTWAHWLQLGTACTVWHLCLMAVFHAYASARQRGGGRGYYLKWVR